jgi:hypothetical protein
LVSEPGATDQLFQSFERDDPFFPIPAAELIRAAAGAVEEVVEEAVDFSCLSSE